ncbi:fibrous sheath CABYR-binding protein-like isoform X1 [Canis lupus familiaris]|uniref:fibrous sheath CABYR-binding protein-like isoform X1 n=1 Tax=Canis lupus familiaris TaxID=9615 RepID=UPI0018F5B45A|nr:fibrous sheath CABYR-binding protein-like isoform X1 [Canis lupus familiaris]
MFSCCLPTSRGSGFQKPQGCGFFTCCGFWFHRHTPRLRAFARRRPKRSTQERGQEWEEENLCSTSLRNGKVPCIAKRGQRGLKVSSGPRVIEPGTAAGVECLAPAEMPGSVFKPMQVVVTAPIHCPNLVEPPETLATLEEEQARVHTIVVPDMPKQPPTSVEQPASALEQHAEPPQEPAQSPTVGSAEASGPDLFKPDTAVGAECFAQVNMPAAELKPMHMVGTPLIHCPNLEEPPAPLAALDEEQSPEAAIKVPEELEQPPVSVQQPASAPEQHHEPCQEPAPATTTGPDEPSGPEMIELVTAAEAECLAGAEMAPADSKPLQVLVTPVIHCPDLEEPPAPVAPPKGEAGPSVCSQVLQRAGAATCLSREAGLGHRAAARDACSPMEGFPSPLVALFLIFVVAINLYNWFMNFVCNKS